MKNAFPVVIIQKLKASALHQHVKHLVKEERRIGVEVLEALREVEARRAYCELGYSSLFKYCVRELGYSETQALRRIDAMRALKEAPELKEKIHSGALTMTTVAMVQSAAKKSRIFGDEKKKLFQKMEGKPVSQVELELKPADLPLVHWLEITDEAKKALTRVKEVSAARFRDLNPSSSELIVMLAEAWLRKNDPVALASREMKNSKDEKVNLVETLPPSLQNQKVSPGAETLARANSSVDPSARANGAVKLETKNATEESEKASPAIRSAPVLRKKSCVRGSNLQETHTRYVPQSVKRAVWVRDQGQCAFRTQAGRRCDSRYALQIDHIVPFARGGSSQDPSNLRLLCSAHNRARVPDRVWPRRR